MNRNIAGRAVVGWSKSETDSFLLVNQRQLPLKDGVFVSR